MSKKSKLLAGVAMPIFSVALTVHSAFAGMPAGLRPAVDINAPALLVQVQAQAQEPETEEMLKRKRQMEEQQNKGAPEKGPAEKGAPEGQHRPEAPRPEAPRPPAAAEPKAEPKAEPRPEPKAEPAPPRAEPPPPKAEPRPEPKAEPAPPKAEPRPESKAAPAERPPEPPKPPVPAAGSERPQPPAPKAEPRPEPKAEAPKPEAPAPRGNGAPAPAEKAAPPVAAPQAAPPAPNSPAPKPPAPAEAPKPPVPPQPPEPSKGAAPAPSANEAAPKPPVPPSGANPPPPPAGAAPNSGQRPVEGGQRPGEGGANRNGAVRPAAPGQPATPGQPAPAGQAAPANQAPGSQPPPPPAPDQAGRPPAPPTAGTPQTQQDIDRAAKIARDPASAPANAQVVLPVQNGAPVLDSAKDYPPPPPQGGPGAAGRPGLPPPPAGAPQADGRRGPPPAPGQAPGRAPGQMPGQPPVAAQQQPMAPAAPPPRTDADAQSFRGQQPPINVQPAISERGRRMDRAPDFALPPGFEGRGQEQDGRTIIQYNNQVFVRHDDDRRFYDEGYRPEYESLPGDRVREIIQRDDGVRIVTIRNRYGDIIQRSRVDRGGSEVVLYYAPEVQETRGRDYVWRDPGLDLPPMRLTVPLDEYIVDTSADENQDYYRFLEQPPVERVERVYSIDEVRYSARIRDKMRRIDLDTITFATGSADIPMNQATTLRKVATAIEAVLKRNPAETFLIEGHTDAVGSDESNLVLSDRRAESVARLLSDVYGIPAENMVTQGYGERYLKVRTDGPNQENRRVTIRRITPLVRPVAAK